MIASQLGLPTDHLVFANRVFLDYITEVVFPNPGDPVCDVVVGAHSRTAATVEGTSCAWGVRGEGKLGWMKTKVL